MFIVIIMKTAKPRRNLLRPFGCGGEPEYIIHNEKSN